VTPDGKVFPYPPWEGPSGTVYGDYLLGEDDLITKLHKNERTQAETERIKEETKLIKEKREEIRDRRQRERLDSIAKQYGIDPNRFGL
jgi:pyruvate-formate lyase